MPDLLGALGIVLFLYPIGWYRIIIRLLVKNRFWWSFILFFSITMPISVYFLENKLQIELQNCTADIPAPTGFSRRTVLYLWYKKEGRNLYETEHKKTAIAFLQRQLCFAMGSVKAPLQPSRDAAGIMRTRIRTASATVMVKQDSGKPSTDRKGNIAAAITDRKKPAKTWMPFLNNREKAG